MTWNELMAELQKHPDMLDTEALIYIDCHSDVRMGEPMPLAGVIERYPDDHFNEDNNLVTFIWDKE